MIDITTAVRRALNKLRYPSVDSDGNLLAEVTPRTDTLANLLAITTAGDGEVATATDSDALVVYRGSPSVGQAYFRGGKIASSVFPLAQDIPISTPTLVQLNSLSSEYPSGVADLQNNEFLIPNMVNGSINARLLLEVSGFMLAFGFSANTVITVRAEFWDGATWIAFALFPNTIELPTGAGTIHFSEKTLLSITNSLAATKVRLMIEQDGATTTGDIISGNIIFTATPLGT